MRRGRLGPVRCLVPRRVLADVAPPTHGPKAPWPLEIPARSRAMRHATRRWPDGITPDSFPARQTPRTGCGDDRMSVEGRSRAIAAMVVVVIHGAVTWVLLRTPLPDAEERADPPALRVRWIERPRSAPPAPSRSEPATLSSSSAHSRVPDMRRRAPSSQRPAQPTSATSTPDPAPDYLAQGATWAAETAPTVDFRPGLTASRVPRLPGGTSRGLFHMREPPSPQKTLRAIGKMLAGPDYTTDPCPQIHDNVYGLLPDTSDEGRRRLAWELREYRERCRP